MELAILVYLASVVTKLGHACSALMTLGTSAAVVYIFWAYESGSKIQFKVPVIALSTLFMLNILLPSEKVMYTMAGAYATQQVIINPATKLIGESVVTILENKLKELATPQK